MSTVLCISITLVSAFSGHSELPSQPAGYALHVLTPTETDFAYIRREIAPIPVEDSGEYLIELWVKVTRFSPLPVGVVFLFDMVDEAGSLRYSVRLTNDRGVMFYYPHGQSSAAFIARDVWELGWWYSYMIRHRGSEAWFYVNQSLVGSSESTGLEALAGGFSIVRISRLGEPESGHVAFEGFADSVKFLVSGAPIFFEDFEAGLEGYEVVKSASAVVEAISPAAYSTLTLIVRPTFVTAGGSVTLVGWLRDSSNFGVANRIIYLEYNLGNGVWTISGAVTTGLDGSFTYEWKLPPELKGQIALRARFLGDAEHAPSESVALQVSIKPPTRPVPDSRYLVLAVSAVVVFAILVFKRRVGTKGILASGFLLTGSLYSFFAFITIVNSLKLEYYLAYQRRIIRLTIFSPSEDVAIWLVSSIALLLLPIALRFVCRIRLPRSFLLASLAFPISGILQFITPREVPTALLSVAGFAIILIGITYAQKMLSMPKSKAASIYVTGFLLILLSIELGSALAWIWNAFDPHYPFDASSRWILPEIEMQIANVGYSLTPWLLLIFVFSWLWLPILKTRTGRLNLKTFWQTVSATVSHENPRGKTPPHWLYSLVGMVLLLLFAGFLVYYPYFYESRLLGVDAKYYYERLMKMVDWQSSLDVLLNDFYAASRAPYFLWLYILKTATGLPGDEVVKIAPILPAWLLGVTSYLFAKVGTRDEAAGFVSAIFAVSSVHTTVGLFAGIFTNWLALSEVLLLLTFALKSSESGSRKYLACGVLMSVLVLFTHAWTWGVLMAVLLVSILLTFMSHRMELGKLRRSSWLVVAGAILISNLAFVSALFFSPVLGGVKQAVNSGYFEVVRSMSFENVVSLLGNLWFTLNYYVGGFMAVPFAFLLGAVGVILAVDMKSDFNRLLVSFLISISIGSTLANTWFQWRYLYLLPLEVFMALGTLLIVGNVGQNHVEPNGSSHLCYRLLRILLLAVIVLMSVNYALRSVNFLIPS